MYKFKKLVLALGLCGAVATGTAAADMKVGPSSHSAARWRCWGRRAIAAWSWPSTRSTPRAASTAKDPDRQGRRGRPDPGRVRNQAPDLVQRDRRVRQLRVRHFLRRLAGHGAGGRALLRAGRHRPQDHHARLQVPVPQQSQHGAVRRVGGQRPARDHRAGHGAESQDIKIGIIHEDGPYGTDVAATEKKRAQELGYTVAECCPIPPRRWTCPRSSCA